MGETGIDRIERMVAFRSFARAMSEIRLAEASDGVSPELAYLQGMSLLGLGREDEARVALERIGPGWRRYPEAVSLLLVCAWISDDWPASGAILEKLALAGADKYRLSAARHIHRLLMEGGGFGTISHDPEDSRNYGQAILEFVEWLLVGGKPDKARKTAKLLALVNWSDGLAQAEALYTAFEINDISGGDGSAGTALTGRCLLRPRLSLCMIVKDEEQDLKRSLGSIGGVADEMVVVDTGSTDATADLARRLGARVIGHVWKEDFAEARNRSLEESLGDWALVLDADEELHPDDRELLRELIRDRNAEGYLVRMLNLVGGSSAPDVENGISLRLFRLRPEYRFTGALHEQIAENIIKARPGAILAKSALRIVHHGYTDEAITAKNKKHRNLKIAQAEVEKYPDDRFRRFNLGIEFMRLENWAEACEHLAAAREGPLGTYWGSKMVKAHNLCLIHLNQINRALLQISSDLLTFPQLTDLVYLKGVGLQMLGRWSEAADEFRRCLEMGPAPVPPYAGVEEGLGGHKAHYALGQVLETLGDRTGAAESYLKAARAHSGWLLPVECLAKLILRSEPAEADEMLEKLFGSAQPDELALLAELFCAGRAYELGLKSIGRIMENGQGGDRLNYLKGLCLLKLTDYRAACQEFLKVPPTSPDYRNAAVRACFCLWADDRFEEAGAFLKSLGTERALQADVAEVFLQEAVEVLEEGLRRFPDSEILINTLGRLKGGTVA